MANEGRRSVRGHDCRSLNRVRGNAVGPAGAAIKFKKEYVLTEKAGQLFCDPALIELDHEPELFELFFNRLGDLLQFRDLDLDVTVRCIPSQNRVQIDSEIGRILRFGRTRRRQNRQNSRTTVNANRPFGQGDPRLLAPA